MRRRRPLRPGRGAGTVAFVRRSGYIRRLQSEGNRKAWVAMRAETESIVEEIKRSLGLLRRHL
ncbi:MAG: hypothetical protein AB7K35_00080 [Pseudorhodoplanes sp.]